MNSQDGRLTRKLSLVEQVGKPFHKKFKFCGTGILHVPNQGARFTRNLSFVEQASCMFLTKVQDVSYNIYDKGEFGKASIIFDIVLDKLVRPVSE